MSIFLGISQSIADGEIRIVKPFHDVDTNEICYITGTRLLTYEGYSTTWKLWRTINNRACTGKTRIRIFFSLN